MPKVECGWFSLNDLRSEDWIRKEAENHFEQWNHPVVWFAKEYELHNSAEFLWNSFVEHRHKMPINGTPHVINFPNTALMLAAMAIECLLKAALFCRIPFPPKPAEIASICKGTHDLEDLIIKVGWRTNEKDRRTLRRLSHFLRWEGRYPLPKSPTELGNARIEATSQESLWEDYGLTRKKLNRRVPASLKIWAQKPKRI